MTSQLIVLPVGALHLGTADSDTQFQTRYSKNRQERSMRLCRGGAF